MVGEGLHHPATKQARGWRFRHRLAIPTWSLWDCEGIASLGLPVVTPTSVVILMVVATSTLMVPVTPSPSGFVVGPIDPDIPPVDGGPVHLYGCLGFLIRGEGYESETSAAFRLPIGNDPAVDHFPVLLESVMQPVIVHVPAQVAHE